MKFITLILAVCLAGPAFAQDPVAAIPPKDPPKFYKLDFVVKELDDNKVVSAKNYSTNIIADSRNRGASIRTGNRVPYMSGGNTQYADIGVNIDCPGVQETGTQQLMLTVIAEISSIPSDSDPTPNRLPMVRQNKWNSVVLVPIGKATVVFSSDDLNSKRKMQLEVTASPIK